MSEEQNERKSLVEYNEKMYKTLHDWIEGSLIKETEHFKKMFWDYEQNIIEIWNKLKSDISVDEALDLLTQFWKLEEEYLQKKEIFKSQLWERQSTAQILNHS